MRRIISISVAPEIYDYAKREAKKDNRTLSNYINNILKERYDKQRAETNGR